MATKADPQVVRKMLEQARNQRTQITSGAPLPIDTAHVVGACVSCGRVGATVLGFPDPPYAGPPGQPRYRSAAELGRFLEQLVQRPPPMPAADDKVVGRGAQGEELRQCACGAPSDPREVAGLRFMHAMPGTGAELIVEGVRGGGSMLVSAAGESLGGDAFTWKVFRAPVDGIETEIASRFDDAPIEKAFGRGLTLANTWKQILDAAKSGKETLTQVEPGYWIYAGPKNSTALSQQITETVGGAPERGDYPIVELGKHAPMPMGPSWPEWAFEHAQAIAKGELRAGAVLDRSVVRQMIVAQLARLHVGSREDPSGIITAESGEARWPVEAAIVALGSAHLGWTFAETVAAAVGEASARVKSIAEFLAAVRAARPDVEFKVEGMHAKPKRKDGTLGRAINLLVTPFRLKPKTPEFDREVRFMCDEIPAGSDPTRLCPCGAKAFLAARLFPWAVAEEFKKATVTKQPYVVNKWPEENPKAALLATISCDVHVRIPAADEIESAGIAGGAFDKRLAEDLSQSSFAVDVSMHEDKAQKRALLAYGPLVASVVMNDHLVSALHDACGRPLRVAGLPSAGGTPTAGGKVEAQVTTPNVLCIYEEGFDDDQLDRVLEAGALADGLAPGAETPFSLTWDVSLTAAPVGRFVNLNPPPPDQRRGPAGSRGAPPRAGAPSGRPPPRN